jgi:hypothetical protein
MPLKRKHIETPLISLVWRTVLRPHTSASSLLPSPLPTRMSLHHSHPHMPQIPHLCYLMYSASAVSSLKRQAWGIRQALCALFPHPTYECISLSPDDASMQTQAAGPRENVRYPRPRYVALWSTVRAHRRYGRSPRPAAIASRHATSRAMQVTSALLLSQAAPAALFSPHSPCLSLYLVHASPHARPYAATGS